MYKFEEIRIGYLVQALWSRSLEGHAKVGQAMSWKGNAWLESEYVLVLEGQGQEKPLSEGICLSELRVSVTSPLFSFAYGIISFACPYPSFFIQNVF